MDVLIWVKIWKWLKDLNTVPFIKKRLVTHIYIRIWSSWLTFTVLQWMKRDFKICQFSRFLLRSEYAIQVKIWKSLKLLNSVPFIKKTLLNQNYFWIWSFDWLSQFCSQWRETPKLVNLKISAKVWVSDFGKKFENDQNYLILFHSSRKHL